MLGRILEQPGSSPPGQVGNSTRLGWRPDALTVAPVGPAQVDECEPMPYNDTSDDAAYAQFHREHDEQSDWPCVTAAGRYLGVHPTLIHYWRRNGCPFLGNRRPASKLFPVEGKPPVLCYAKASLDQIKAAKEALPTKVHSQPGEWITREQAMAIMDCSETALGVAARRGSPYLGGRRIATHRKPGVRSDGHACKILRYSRSDVEELARRRAPAASRGAARRSGRPRRFWALRVNR